jgi:hypothetical protein
MHETGKCWERGRLVRIPSDERYTRIEYIRRFSRCALSADGTSAFPAIT